MNLLSLTFSATFCNGWPRLKFYIDDNLCHECKIDLDNVTYRSIHSLFGFHFGKWKPCPKFEYVSVFKTTENQTVRVITAETTLQNDIILLNLFYNGNKHITFYKTQDKNDAFKVAEKFKLIFNIDILDATESEKKWL